VSEYLLGKNFEVGGLIYSLLLVVDLLQDSLINYKKFRRSYPLTQTGFELLIYRIAM
jgi:hypothetical protein